MPGSPSSAEVTVSDDDDSSVGQPSGPRLTIAAASQSVQEGATAEFTVTASPAPMADLIVDVTLTETHSMLAPSPPSTVTIVAGATTATLSVPTVNDAEAEPHSTVTASVTGAAGYEVGSPASARVVVTDDDGSSTGPQQPQDPRLTIEAGGSSVTEGAAVVFTVKAMPAPQTDLTVPVTVTETQSMLAPSPPSTVTITAGTTAATLTVPTVDDAEDEAASRVTATVTAVAPYEVGSPGSAVVTVNDNDPTVSFQAANTAVDEGSDLVVTVHASTAPVANFVVNVSWYETGSMLSGVAPSTVTIAAGMTTATLTAQTDDDTLKEDPSTSTVTVVLDRGTGYSVGSPRLIVFTVSDND